MRAFGLLALVILFPASAHAADPITLNPYTISHDTIYPSATAGSGLATTTAIDIRFSEQVRASIKIMSASGTKVRLLYPSSGSSSGPVTDPTPKIWDGMNDAGTRVDDGVYTILISATSTDGLNLTMTDSSKTITVASSGGSPPPADSSAATVTTSSSGSGPAEYLPIPTLRILTSGARTVSAGADSAFTAVVYDGRGNKRDDATVIWSFGDGMRRTGSSVFHGYYDPGEYIVIVHVSTSDGGDASSEIVMTVKDVSVRIVSVSSRGISIMNRDTRTLDLSLWRLSAGGQEFKIPADTRILAGRTILFPSQVIELPMTGSALLLYPSGEIAAAYPAVVAAPQTNSSQQLFPDATSYEQVQAVEQIISTKSNIQAHDEAVEAPTAANELAAVGAVSSSRAAGIFNSPWTLGLLGVIVLAGSAFILL
jgi:hypothetical protein